MSTSSIRSHKETGSASDKVTALVPVKSVTPIRYKGSGNVPEKHTGKENRRPGSRVRAASSQKTGLRPMPRIEKPVPQACADAEPRVLRLTPLAPKGRRSSSPANFCRMLSDSRKQRDLRSSLDRSNEVLFSENDQSGLSGGKGLIRGRVPGKTLLKKSLKSVDENMMEGASSEARAPMKCKYSVCSAVNVIKKMEHERGLERVRRNEENKNCLKDADVLSDSKEAEPGLDLQNLGEVRVYGAGNCYKEYSVPDFNASSCLQKLSDGINLFVKAPREQSLDKIENFAGWEGKRLNNEYPTKLHQKLALLESKVQSITSDIKRAKDLLDMNLPSGSRLVLSEIQEKISGIETMNDKIQLEASLFPLKSDRIEGKPASPSDEDAIALEFLASLCEEEHSMSSTMDELGAADLDDEVQETDGDSASEAPGSLNTSHKKCNPEVVPATGESFDEFDDLENRLDEETEDASTDQLKQIGLKAATGGWFVSEGESVLLAHDDGSCSLYDVTNCEGKAEYKPPGGLPPDLWRDCWVIRAPGSDGCSGKYVVAASAGNFMNSGFCSWDFYSKDVKAFHMEEAATATASRRGLGSPQSIIDCHRNQRWWYGPCGPLIVSTASSQKTVTAYDIRDGERIMRWEVQSPVLSMDYSCPLQWRDKGKVVIAETEAISLYDVNSLSPRASPSVLSNGRRVTALHVNNRDAEPGGGIRRRASALDAEGNDGAFCTHDSVNVLDFRQPSGVGLKLSSHGVRADSVFSRGDSVYVGCSAVPQIRHFSVRMGGLVTTYALPAGGHGREGLGMARVWGDSTVAMGVCAAAGLVVFDALRREGGPAVVCGGGRSVRDPSFDYSSDRVLLVHRDRPAMWKCLA